jgi:predicted transposase/invertase (TIGR01784 family)
METAWEKGVRKGREGGREEGIIVMAKNLLSLKVPLETISQATGLSLADIKRLQLGANL